MDGHDPQQNITGPYYNVATPTQALPESAEKRKQPDNNNNTDGGQPRTKRNRYISIACNECKRRKIKCNGNTPCHRCGNLSLDCIYATNGVGPDFKDSAYCSLSKEKIWGKADIRSREYRGMTAQINSLQEQVNHLWASLEALRNGQPFPIPPLPQSQDQYSIHPSLSQQDPFRHALPPSQSNESQAHFQGPTSAAFSFDVARSSLQSMGIAASELQDDGFNGSHTIPKDSPQQQQRAPMAPMTIHPNKDPLWKIARDEAIRLCKVYEEETGLMYPMLDIDKIIIQTNMLFNFTESAARSGLMNPYKSGPDNLGNNDVYILKMVLATALIVEGEGQSELGRELYESCREAIEGRLSGPVEMKGLILLVLVVRMTVWSYFNIH